MGIILQQWEYYFLFLLVLGCLVFVVLFFFLFLIHSDFHQLIIRFKRDTCMGKVYCFSKHEQKKKAYTFL